MNQTDIVFVQKYATPYFGILSIIAHLKCNNFTYDVLIDSLEKDLIKTLKALNPKIVGFSVLSTEHKWLIEKSKLVKEALPDALIVAGGIHCIFYPEEILKKSCVDIVSHSEGELVTQEIIKEFAKQNSDWSAIEGICYKDSDGTMHINDRAPLVPFNSEIIEERDCYYNRYPVLKKDSAHRFFSSRGCPYRCSFCYNSNIQDVFKNKGAYVRQKTPESFLKEIKYEYSKYGIDFIFFYDDLFTFNKQWLKQFLELYKKEISLPFMCTTRANLLDEETAKMLADAGCYTASFGLESGDEELRKTVLNKKVSDEQIINCGNLLNKYGIKVQTSNMFCLPEETVEQAFRTIDLNIKAKVNFALSALFMPFPKTEIADYCISKKLIKADYGLNDLPISFMMSSLLDNPDKEIIINISRLAFFFVKYPLLYKYFRNIVYVKQLNPLFYIISLFSNILRHKEERNISWIQVLRYAWRFRKSI